MVNLTLTVARSRAIVKAKTRVPPGAARQTIEPATLITNGEIAPNG
jgi:hypothetical protein